MVNSETRYDQYKMRVSVMQVALELGYTYDRKKGRVTPSFVLKDSRGKEIDRIFIKNPHNTAKNYWWRPTGNGTRQWGDVIQLVRDNINSFPEAATCRNTTDAINRVLSRLANMPEDGQQMVREFLEAQNYRPSKPFNLERYERFTGSVDTAMKFLSERGITRETAEMFKDCFECIRDKESTYKYKNLAFPYTQPGEMSRSGAEKGIVGFEVRGFKGFKSKAEGSDSTRSSWQAYLGTAPNPTIRKIHIAESALDIMAYVQLRGRYLDLNETFFVSLGGTFSNDQLTGLMKAYPEAQPVLHFDNDINGVMYDIRAACLLENKPLTTAKAGENINFNVGEKAFSLPIEGMTYNKFREKSGLRPAMQIEKAPLGHKDWNDVLIKGLETPKDNQKAVANQAQQERYGTAREGRIRPMPDGGGTGGSEKTDQEEESPTRGFRR